MRVGEERVPLGGLGLSCGDKSGLTLQAFGAEREALEMTGLQGTLYLSCTTLPPGLLLKLPMPRPDPKTNEVRISGWDSDRGGPTVLLTFKTSELISFEHKVCM